MSDSSNANSSNVRGRKPPPRKTQFVMVLNNPTPLELDSLPKIVSGGVLTYLFGGREVGEEGTPHLQCCGRSKNPVSISALHVNISNVTGIKSRWAIHVMKCPLEKNKQYCAKGTQPKAEWLEFNELGPNYGIGADTFEHGSPPKGRGARTDLDEVAASIRNGDSEVEIAEQHGASYIKYFGGIRELMGLCKSQDRSHVTRGYWCYGPTGTGKSRWANSIPGAKYLKDPTNKWFDGYLNQETVIIDDYRPSKELGFAQLLRLADRYPMTVERKGGTRVFNAQRLVVTTPLRIEQTFAHLEFLTDGSIDQLKRRFKEIPFGNQLGDSDHTLSLAELEPPTVIVPSESLGTTEE